MKYYLIFLSLFISSFTYGEELPLWEYGVGGGVLSTPHYLGSNQRKTYILPVPYGVYRGEYIQSDRGGLAGKIYDSNNLDLRISLGGALPVNSEDNEARAGMTDLGFMLEAGPTLQYTLRKTNNSVIRLDLPVRMAISFDNQPNYRGFTTNPKLYTKHHFGTWKLATNIGPTFGTQRYHDYFYTVDEKYVLADRQAYQAKSGYTGFRTSASLSKNWGSVFTGVFVNYYYLGGNRNSDSPLMKTNDYAAFGVSVSWIIEKSPQMVNYDSF